jgi:hypothetical protein
LVVYVDHNPVVLAHGRALLVSRDEGATAYIDADLRDTDRILAEAAELLDLASRSRSRCAPSCMQHPTQTTRTRSSPGESAPSLRARSREQIDRFFAGMDLLAPGWCQSRNGARTLPWPTRARRLCTAR